MIANLKTISLALAVNIVAGGAFAITAQNTSMDNSAAYKTNMFSGYDVTGIVFELGETEPTLVDSISFKIAPSTGSTKADYVRIQTEVGGAWTECVLVDDVLPARMATCAFESLAAEEVTGLNIVTK